MRAAFEWIHPWHTSQSSNRRIRGRLLLAKVYASAVVFFRAELSDNERRRNGLSLLSYRRSGSARCDETNGAFRPDSDIRKSRERTLVALVAHLHLVISRN